MTRQAARPSARLLRASAAAVLYGALCGVASAAGLDINNLQNVTQQDFHYLNEDLGAAMSYKPLIPSAPLGVTGIDLGVALTGTELRHRDAIQNAVSGSRVYSVVPIPTLRLDKGLPLDLDVGLMVGRAPNTDITLWGGELRWAFLPGDAVLPAVAVRAAATQMSGVTDLKLSTQSIDLSVSKGFLLVTPYGGAGVVRIQSTPQGIPTLASETFYRGKVFAGVDVNLGLGNLDFEVDEVGNVPSIGVKIGFRF